MLCVERGGGVTMQHDDEQHLSRSRLLRVGAGPSQLSAAGRSGSSRRTSISPATAAARSRIPAKSAAASLSVIGTPAARSHGSHSPYPHHALAAFSSASFSSRVPARSASAAEHDDPPADTSSHAAASSSATHADQHIRDLFHFHGIPYSEDAPAEPAGVHGADHAMIGHGDTLAPPAHAHPHPHTWADPLAMNMGGIQQQHQQPAMSPLGTADWTPYPSDDNQAMTSGADGVLPVVYPEVADLYGPDPGMHLRLQSLPVLDNLSSRIILTLARTSLASIAHTRNNMNLDDELQALTARKNIFDQTLKVYSRNTPFVDARTIALFTEPQRRILYKANLAVFISSLLHSQTITLLDLSRYSLDCFLPPGQPFSRWHTTVLLGLRTQSYISAILSGDVDLATALHELFPDQLGALLARRHPDQPQLTADEQDFVNQARARRNHLVSVPFNAALTTLSTQFPWSKFIHDFTRGINDHLNELLGMQSQPAQPMSQRSHPHIQMPGSDMTNRQVQHPLPANNAFSGDGFQNYSTAVSSYDSRDLTPKTASTAPRSAAASTSQPSSVAGESEPSPSSTKATLATSVVRQPWRPEEEAALLAGLAEVKGQHWSRILSLYGKGGSKSEVLKDRTQIQLKDKARNLKLWHLKTGSPVPHCLQGVTGDLKKRGGAKVRAALKAEEEGARGSGMGPSM